MICINPKCGAELAEGSNFCHVCGRRQKPKQRRRVRANGQGSVYQLPSGRWRAEKTLGYRLDPVPEGAPETVKPKKHRVAVAVSTFRTKSEALTALPFITAARKRSNSDRATGKGERITLKELFDQWEPTHQRGESTMNCYRAGFRLFAPLWFVHMAEIEVDDLQDCLDDAEQGKRTKENARAALGLVYKYGIPRNCVPKDRNLAQFLTIRAEGSSKKPGLSLEELEKIRKAAAAGDRVAKIVLCHCYLGFRPTALLALQVVDYDAKERAFVGGIKTEAGIGRTVTVSPKIQPYVTGFVGSRTVGPVFCLEDGEVLGLADYRAAFYALLERLGIDNPVDEQGRHRLTPHSCRHTFATLMKAVSGSDTDKLALIGHTSTSQLRDYQDVRYEDLRKITDQI